MGVVDLVFVGCSQVSFSLSSKLSKFDIRQFRDFTASLDRRARSDGLGSHTVIVFINTCVVSDEIFVGNTHREPLVFHWVILVPRVFRLFGQRLTS